MDNWIPVVGLVELEWFLLRRWLVVVPVALLVLVLIRKYGVEKGEQHKEGALPGSKLAWAARAYAIKPWLVKMIVLSPIVITLVYGCVLFFPQSSAYSVVSESIAINEQNPVEMLTFVFELLAIILGLALAWHLKKRGDTFLVIGFYVLFAIGMLWTAGEEEAWGQWFVGKEALPTPSWLEDENVQAEITLHNVGGIYGSDLWLRLGFGLGGLVGTWVSSWPRFRKVGAPLILLPWFLIIIGINSYEALGKLLIMTSQLELPELLYEFQELSELMIGVSAFLFVWLNARRMLSSTPRASSVDKSDATHLSDQPR